MSVPSRSNVPGMNTRLDYAAGMAWSTGWGQASCRRAFLASVLIAYLLLTTYSNYPRNTLTLVFVWPLVLTCCGFGIGYGVIGLRRECRKRWTIFGLVANAILMTPATLATFDAAREMYAAYRYADGVIVMSNR